MDIDKHIKAFQKIGLSPNFIKKLKIYEQLLIDFNKDYNLVSKNSLNDLWNRHFLDSAQLTKFIVFNDNKSLSDLGSGAGFPGMILAIINENPNFHVKLYEKSPIKCKFLTILREKLRINVDILNVDINYANINSEYIVCRAFKKLDNIIQVSREKFQKPYKIIILKGKNAQDEVKKTLKKIKFKYRLEKSITDSKSKILIVEE